MITIERAKELLGFVPKYPENYEFFLKHIDEQKLEEKGEEWLKEHRGLIQAGWEITETLL
jgi:hypothetical protein